MSWSWPLAKPVCVLMSVPLLLGAGVSTSASAPRKAGLQVRVPDRAGMAVRRAVLSVKRRLADETCRLVLSDFSSSIQGRSLGDVLELHGRTAEEQLDSLIFKDGSGQRGCASPAILAYTHIGSDTIHVCAGPFYRATQSDPALAEMVLIHEWLHTLGLGENPPTSREITARVTERCGDWRTLVAATSPPRTP